MSGRKPPDTRHDRGEAESVRKVAERAVRRLDVVEYALLGGAALLSVGAGALVAVLLAGPTGLSFGLVWTVASLILFVVPGLGTWLRNREPRGGVRHDSPPGRGGASARGGASRPGGGGDRQED